MRFVSTTSRGAGAVSGGRAALPRSARDRRKTIGEAHPDYAIHLNNLALVVQAQGRMPRPRDFTARRWRSTAKPSARRIPTMPPTSTTSRAWCRRRGGMRRPSRSTARRWRSPQDHRRGASRLCHPPRSTSATFWAETDRAAEGRAMLEQALAIFRAALRSPAYRRGAARLRRLERGRGDTGITIDSGDMARRYHIRRRHALFPLAPGRVGRADTLWRCPCGARRRGCAGDRRRLDPAIRHARDRRGLYRRDRAGGAAPSAPPGISPARSARARRSSCSVHQGLQGGFTRDAGDLYALGRS